jgi:hypothetical protein
MTGAKFVATDLRSGFALPLSVEAFEEYQEVLEIIGETQLTPTRKDSRSFIWGNKYTSSRFYRFLFEQLPKDGALNAIWNSKAMPKLRFFPGCLWSID